ncbi:hypothetical protein QWZ04_08230 [Vibrio tapetis subsp. quintayensis]|uniref:hypothetical protein n=1 Tax=Vibrio tapetis TaxID=52443 RepID=UPI0025B28769|nr:hypothetical protein [Vibrio tapetis]MDN3680312.1 hypothetical protein [Vibrio tapetis subsp. quintayensis]
MKLKTIIPHLILGSTIASVAYAQVEEIQDMSDPLAVYSQLGLGWTQQGFNLKMGQTYDTGSEDTMAQHILELKGFAGSLGTSDNADNSLDSLRYRHFNVDLTNGRGAQIDLDWNFDNDIGSASYSMIQALPKFGRVQLYPLAGIGVTVQDDQGYTVPASFGLVGMYGKLELTDKIWVNYNPMYTNQLGGNDEFEDVFGFSNEAAISYQLNAKQNVRAFWNWGETTNGTDFRIEMNMQF